MGKTRQTANLASNFTILSSNVGIGSTIPDSKLDVVGDFQVSGVSTFAGVTTATGTTLLTRQLNVSGVSTFSQNVNIGSGVTIYPASGIVSATTYYENGQLLINKIKSTAIGITLIFG
jgi:hypothetical protein